MESALGVIAVTPLLLVFRQQCLRFAELTLEHVTAFSILILWSAAVFGGWWEDRLGPYARAFTLFRVICWIACASVSAVSCQSRSSALLLARLQASHPEVLAASGIHADPARRFATSSIAVCSDDAGFWPVIRHPSRTA